MSLSELVTLLVVEPAALAWRARTMSDRVDSIESRNRATRESILTKPAARALSENDSRGRNVVVESSSQSSIVGFL